MLVVLKFVRYADSQTKNGYKFCCLFVTFHSKVNQRSVGLEDKKESLFLTINEHFIYKIPAMSGTILKLC